ncbi:MULTISPECIES: sigma 54-interacting transcriptional regulator [Methylobacterium]|uniref:Anaerobic nitric oxide reductase transcription regulator NorR n=5 Tax=Pseudomonadota TaxID=1224 RepID=A0ABQ4SZF1_9HYPH|nr:MULTISPECIES: sigma 54-interacting transcriptional regulator [Methylobacterium]GBU19068.1 transcriptional regulator [Methylobacterium sp.]GJE07924.1 Anaerobic nitric oxide reductase transcription regulator NorR [Methylobacterium jeotgali]
MTTISRNPSDLGPAFEANPEAMLAIDPMADRIVAANPSVAALLGTDPATLAGSPVSALHPGQRAALLAFTEGVLERGRWRTRDLAPRARVEVPPLEYAGFRLDGTPPLIVVTLSDLDARHRREVDGAAEAHMRAGLGEWQRMERVFRDLERENRLILSAAGEGIYGVDADGLTTFVNPAAERMLGWAASDLIGRDMHAAVHHKHPDGSHYPHRDCPIYAAFRDGAVHQVDDEVFWRKDGTGFPVEYTSTPIRDRGVLLGAVIVFRDVSGRREADERLRRALAEVDSLRERLELENAYLKEEIRAGTRHAGIIGRSPATEAVLRQIDVVAGTDATVLVTGESGTGKELIAHAIHEASRRRERPLIRVNCAAVPRELFESEFFGHAKGAFTGALRDRVGRFELADGGTLFLDEVGEIPLDLQGKLLRVLQERQFERVGEERTRSVDVRVVAATNRDLREEVRRGRFREDLYFRLNVFPIAAVPLRERPEDIPSLARHFVASAARRLRVPEPRLSEGDVRRLTRYPWPGNVRELENVIERGTILAVRGRLHLDLPEASEVPQERRSLLPAPEGRPPNEVERRARDRADIEAALRLSRNRVSGPGGAADILGVRPTTLASRIRALGIRRDAER